MWELKPHISHQDEDGMLLSIVRMKKKSFLKKVIFRLMIDPEAVNFSHHSYGVLSLGMGSVA